MIWGVFGWWVLLLVGELGLKVIVVVFDGIWVDGVVVDGEVIVWGRDDVVLSVIVFSDIVSGFVICFDGGSYVLWVFDVILEVIENFGGIDVFDYDFEWVVMVDWFENLVGIIVGFDCLKDGGQMCEEVVLGKIIFICDGIDYDLVVFILGCVLQIVFFDVISGVFSYSVGCFFFVVFNVDGIIIFDFNCVILLFCVFSYVFNCLMLLKQN